MPPRLSDVASLSLVEKKTTSPAPTGEKSRLPAPTSKKTGAASLNRSRAKKNSPPPPRYCLPARQPNRSRGLHCGCHSCCCPGAATACCLLPAPPLPLCLALVLVLPLLHAQLQLTLGKAHPPLQHGDASKQGLTGAVRIKPGSRGVGGRGGGLRLGGSHTHTRARTHTRTRAHTHTRTRAHTHTHTHAHAHSHTTQHTHTHTQPAMQGGLRPHLCLALPPTAPCLPPCSPRPPPPPSPSPHSTHRMRSHFASASASLSRRSCTCECPGAAGAE